MYVAPIYVRGLIRILELRCKLLHYTCYFYLFYQYGSKCIAFLLKKIAVKTEIRVHMSYDFIQY